MNKFNLSENEKGLLKVAKMNQIESESLKLEINVLSSEMEERIENGDAFLKEVESQNGIIYNQNTLTDNTFVRENEQEIIEEWDNLVLEAEESVPKDIDFEELLSQSEIKEAYARINEIDAAFEKRTGLRKKDIKFMALAVALQCVRQYLIDPWLKEHRRGASQNDEKGRKGKTEPGWYYVDTDKILTNRVPFDVQHYGKNKSIKGFLRGGDHRSMTLGHDPVLGWIFGTINIMTNTVTRRDFISAHVKCINNENKIYSLASTKRAFEAVVERVADKGIDGKRALCAAIVREAIHLKSDIDTKDSLPLPIINALDEELASKLAQYGIDTASVSTEASFSYLVNEIIGMIHCLCFDETTDEKECYEVRTRKIILYSNLIASTSNVIASVLTNSGHLLDVGGMLITISRLITDVRFICKVKDEFVDSELTADFEGIQAELDDLYSKRFD